MHVLTRECWPCVALHRHRRCSAHYSLHPISVGFGVSATSAISCLPFRCFISLRGVLALCVAHTAGTIESCCQRAIRVVSMVFPWSPHVWCCAEAIVVARA